MLICRHSDEQISMKSYRLLGLGLWVILANLFFLATSTLSHDSRLIVIHTSQLTREVKDTDKGIFTFLKLQLLTERRKTWVIFILFIAHTYCIKAYDDIL